MKTVTSLQQYFKKHPKEHRAFFILLGISCLLPFFSAPLALVLGFFTAISIGNPYEIRTKKLTQLLLQFSVVGLGFGMNMDSALKAGKEGFIFTILSIIAVLLLGFILMRLFKIERITAYLIAAGTAICGGSAIAAVAPVIKAKPGQISVALAAVFILNAAALILFPLIGHWLHLSQHQFGLWSAIAIHDTSSVVGAGSKYGTEALQIATTVKLARALWIIPLSFFSVLLFKNKEANIKIPWFIGCFVIAICLNTYVPMIQTLSPYLVSLAKSGLMLTLFLIGAGLSFKVIRTVGVKPLLFALVLWFFIAAASLLVIVGQ